MPDNGDEIYLDLYLGFQNALLEKAEAPQKVHQMACDSWSEKERETDSEISLILFFDLDIKSIFIGKYILQRFCAIVMRVPRIKMKKSFRFILFFVV